MSEATAPRPYSWLRLLIFVMTVVTLAIGAIALHYMETRMVASAGETLALTANQVSDKLDRVSYRTVWRCADDGTDDQCAAAQSGVSVGVSHLDEDIVPDYLWLGVTNARGQIVVATDPATVGRDYSAEPSTGMGGDNEHIMKIAK